MNIWTIVWQSVLLSTASMLLLKMGGRKSASEMTIPQIGTLITIGAVLGSDVGGRGVGYSILAAAIFIGSLVGVEWITLHWNRAEKLLKGEALPIIVDGEILMNNLKRLRISIDDLEKRLRLAGVTQLSDVKTGTIEDNGELGIELKTEAKPVTVGDLERALQSYFTKYTAPTVQSEGSNIFTEVVLNHNSHHIPKDLQ